MAKPQRQPAPQHRGSRARRPQPGARLPAAERRDLVLQAFRDEALAVGSLAGVGMRAVCARAGCTAPVVYRLFGSREGLVRAAVRSTQLGLVAQLDALAQQVERPAWERLEGLGRRFLSKELGDDEAFEALVNTECRSDPAVARHVRQVFDRFERALAEIVRDGVRRGEFARDVDPRYVAWRLIDLGLFRNQHALMRLTGPHEIDYLTRALESLLAEIAA
ncbi:MAG: TetR/AcrR family transcriptional regulator [Proteobacteria bacterium]|nr:TetR/AcrR family transcriptional regulator [Pseudomonadota bacterium]